MGSKPRGQCSACGRDSSVKRNGKVQMHWVPDAEHPSMSVPCTGAGKPPKGVSA